MAQSSLELCIVVVRAGKRAPTRRLLLLGSLKTVKGEGGTVRVERRARTLATLPAVAGSSSASDLCAKLLDGNRVICRASRWSALTPQPQPRSL